MLFRNIVLSTFLVAILFSSCKKFLDVVPSEVITSENIWGDINNANKALARLYNALPNETRSSTEYWSSTDEAKNHWENPASLLYNNGSWGPTNNPFGNWEGTYSDIRKASLFIANIEKVPLNADQAVFYSPRIPRFKAEARFLRAMYYFQLFKKYGAVPIIYDILNLDDPLASQLPRNSADEVVEYIVKELDEILPLLPQSYETADVGRITQGAVLALKSRTLLYAASPLFNGNKLYTNVKNPDGKQLFSQVYDAEKWKKAADAAKKVLDLGIYSLYSPTPSNPVNNYAQLFYTREYNETILAYTVGNNKDFEWDLVPNGAQFGGHGRFSVLQELIDAYEMKNGYPINVTGSGYVSMGAWDGQLWDGLKFSPVSNISNMYKDRDPRFYASIFFQYSVWRLDKVGRPVKLSWWSNNNNNSDGWPKSGTNCESGYNIRKWVSPEVDLKSGTGDARRNIPIFRLAEIYLNYAEALNETLPAPDQRVYDAINAVRARVSMPALPILPSDQTKDGMQARIRNERRIELAFEAQRFWDVRRWLIAKQVDNTNVHGMNARPTTAELTGSGFNPNSEEAGLAVFYKPVIIQSRVFQDKHYLMPIPKSEIDKDPNIVQNFGW
ncbi:MAG: RagB/SusD family nutrient uptake outer membrane protein [Ferruginibacter sp.]